MMVTFISQCEKNALNKTRRVLDAFADRIGDNTWQTLITEDGLQTVKRMLRQMASKNTAVSCFWIRSRSRSQFLWVVGNKDKFNERGLVPVNRTKKNLLNSHIESDWKYLPLIKSLTAISALLHDWGKASQLFQDKLNPKSKNKYKGDPIRHEWISTLLLNVLVNSGDAQDDKTWLSKLNKGDIDEEQLKRVSSERINNPLSDLPDAAKLVAWLIVSHHRLPLPTDTDDFKDVNVTDMDESLNYIVQSWGYENRYDEQEYKARVQKCFQFPKGLLSQSNRWLKEIKRWSNKLLFNLPLIESAFADGSYRLVLHHSRLCLMLGDHNYSSQNAAKGWNDSSGLFANTDRETKEYKQKLDEHLVGVAKTALDAAHLLPAFEQEPPLATDIEFLRKLSPKTPVNYSWQDKAVKKITEWKTVQKKLEQGFFTVNMASTGCGKTTANAKVMRALSIDGKSLRYILALGLRTLTLQTGDEYRQLIGLDNTQLAVLIGSKAVAELHNKSVQEDAPLNAEESGSESQEALLDEFIDYKCDIPDSILSTVLKKEKDKQFLYAPVLACTIDHIMSATETQRGGRYILPSLRLMSSDLVIDEVDDFTGDDLIAIGRLIHLAGMLGRKVMISSATIPPSLAEGYFNAYKKGWQIYSQSRDNAENTIGCSWIDEFNTTVESINTTQSEKAITEYKENHDNFITKRVTNLKEQPVKRKAEIIKCALKSESDETNKEQYFNHIKQVVLVKHQQHHTVDEQTSKQVSFGVVRVANIVPCVELTKYLLQASYPDDVEVKVMAYHSQQVLLLRHEQEKHLDEVLKRKEKIGEQPKAFNNSVIRSHLDCSTAKNVIFILVATPVEEVGRDHDFDWAVVEPSSYRSIVQLAGRVRRHRTAEVVQANIALMQYNYKAFKDGNQLGKKYFIRPGYEEYTAKAFSTHDLCKLINESHVAKSLNAIPRICQLKQSEQEHLAAIEHKVTRDALCSYTRYGPEALEGYLSQTWFLTALPQKLNPFRKSEPNTKIFLVSNSDDEACYFTQKDEQGCRVTDINGDVMKVDGLLQITHVELSDYECSNLWLKRYYISLLNEYKNDVDLDTVRKVSLRYGELSFVERDNDKYEYNDQFGLVKK
jgi:CRISPR-associated endonuclease/helicase Cas3